MLILALLFGALHAFAGVEIGNGGDGVLIVEDGYRESVYFYDLVEQRAMQADKIRQEANVEIDADLKNRVNEAVRSALWPVILLSKEQIEAKLVEYKHCTLPEIECDNLLYVGSITEIRVNQYIQALAFHLSLLNKVEPKMVNDILSQLKKMEFTESLEDLKPNRDTNPLLSVPELSSENTKASLFGCARHEVNGVLVSPSCLDSKISPSQFAALLVHESLYALLKAKDPSISDSLAVRIVVGEIFKASPERLPNLEVLHSFSRLLSQLQ